MLSSATIRHAVSRLASATRAPGTLRTLTNLPQPDQSHKPTRNDGRVKLQTSTRSHSTAPTAGSSFSQADLPKCDFTPEKYDGPSNEQIMKWRKAHINPAIYTLYKEPLHLTQGFMQYVFDEQGQRYLDFLGGIVTISVGHCHPKVLAALHKQSKRIWHCTTIYNHAPLAEYAHKLASKFPEPLKYVYFVNSGSEANDLALMLARLHTGCQDIVSLRYAYHGLSPYSQALSALSTWRHNIPLSPGHHHAITPDTYKGPVGGKNCRNSMSQPDRDCDCQPGECKACDFYVNDVEDLLKATCSKTKVGGFMAESIMGSAGTIQFPRDYLSRVYPMIRARGGVCIADEVQTGFGRTGQAYWGFQTHPNAQPDIVTMAKGIGNGIPLAAVVTTAEIASSLTRASHFNTFGGNPLACAVGSAVMDVIEEDKLQENSKVVGAYAMKKLIELKKRHSSIVGDVRGLGLMFALELVEDPAKKTPLHIDKVNELMDLLREKFVLVGRTGLTNSVIRCSPPMCSTTADVDYFIGAFDASLTQLTSKSN